MNNKQMTWTHIRIRRSTLQMLEAWISRTDAAFARGNKVEHPGEQGYSCDQAIRMLIEHHNAKRERGRRKPQLSPDGKRYVRPG